MNLYKKEMKSNLKIFIIWTTVFVVFLSMYISISDQILDQSESMLNIINSMPDFLKKAFNLREELITKPEGIFGGEGMIFIYILGAIFIATISGNVFSKEYESKTIEYLIIKPMNRKNIFLQKFLCLLSYTILLNLIFTFFLIIEFHFLISYEYNVFTLYVFGFYSFISQFFYLGFSVLSSTYFQKSSMNMSISIFMVIFMYFGDTLAKLSDVLSFLSIFSIYNYMSISDLIIKQKVYYSNSIMIVLFSAVLIVLAYFSFLKKDIIIN